MIFHEAPHKLRTTLDDLCAAFGPDRRVALCRELTKLHEEVRRTTLGEAAAYYAETAPKGEFVLVIAGAPAPEEAAVSLEDGAAMRFQSSGNPELRKKRIEYTKQKGN